MAKEEPAKPKRRIVKKAETVREKVEKSAKVNAKPKNQGIVRLTFYYIFWPFRFVGRGIKKVGRFFVPKYFKASWAELKQVTWPTGREAWKLTLAVIIFAIIFGAVITVVDIGLDKLFKKVILD
jgi:preprotein translocase SecE subunit